MADRSAPLPVHVSAVRPDGTEDEAARAQFADVEHAQGYARGLVRAGRYVTVTVTDDSGQVLNAPQPDSRSLVRDRARRVAAAQPGEWVAWKTYPAGQEATARVAASDIRRGKVKTVARLAGAVETRMVRLPDGRVEVQVTRSAAR